MTGKKVLFILACVLVATAAMGLFAYFNIYAPDSASNDAIHRWLSGDVDRESWITDNAQPCAGAPFLLPSAGFIGLLYADTARPYNGLHRHSGVDIFGDGPPGTIPIVAAYDGYLTRLDDWKSTVIIRHDDPLQPGRIIWTYYTHMANLKGDESFIVDDFPPGTQAQFVKQGTLLGYQGDYAGAGAPIAMHLHFSLVQSDPDGMFKNEAILSNTLDPTPYLGLALHVDDDPDRPIRCAGG